MKTTLAKHIVCAMILFLVVSCSRKASIYSENFSKTNFIETSYTGFNEQNIANNNFLSFSFENKIGSYFGSKSLSIDNYNGSSASAQISVTILDPATITKTDDLVFDKISLKNLKNKFVSLNDIGANYKRIVVPNLYSNEAKAQASFSVGGANNVALDVNVPKQIDLYHKNGTDIISAIIDTKSNSKKSAEIYNYDFLINGKIYFNSLTVPGNYSSKDFAVTVHYN